MILAWTLLLALSGVDAGVEPAQPLELRGDCKPPGYWDKQAKACKPGCGIPTRWENGVEVGGCGNHDKRVTPELPKKTMKPMETMKP